jgi:hypothetical protein
MFKAIIDLLSSGPRKRQEQFFSETMNMMQRSDELDRRLDSFTRFIGMDPEKMSFDYKTAFFLCSGLHLVLEAKGLMNNEDVELHPTDIHQKGALLTLLSMGIHMVFAESHTEEMLASHQVKEHKAAILENTTALVLIEKPDSDAVLAAMGYGSGLYKSILDLTPAPLQLAYDAWQARLYGPDPTFVERMSKAFDDVVAYSKQPA